MGEGGFKIVQNCVTSFVDDPLTLTLSYIHNYALSKNVNFNVKQALITYFSFIRITSLERPKKLVIKKYYNVRNQFSQLSKVLNFEFCFHRRHLMYNNI